MQQEEAQGCGQVSSPGTGCFRIAVGPVCPACSTASFNALPRPPLSRLLAELFKRIADTNISVDDVVGAAAAAAAAAGKKKTATVLESKWARPAWSDGVSTFCVSHYPHVSSAVAALQQAPSRCPKRPVRQRRRSFFTCAPSSACSPILRPIAPRGG